MHPECFATCHAGARAKTNSVGGTCWLRSAQRGPELLFPAAVDEVFDVEFVVVAAFAPFEEFWKTSRHHRQLKLF